VGEKKGFQNRKKGGESSTDRVVNRKVKKLWRGQTRKRVVGGGCLLRKKPHLRRGKKEKEGDLWP